MSDTASTSHNQPEATKKGNNKRSLILVAVAFLLPVILAKIVLEMGWFERGATNKGQLIEPVIDFNAHFSELAPKWRLLYVIPEVCDTTCENTLFTLQQVHYSLGKRMDRVQPLVISTENSAANVLTPEFWGPIYQRFGAAEATHTIQILPISNKNVKNLFSDVGVDAIFIVDTLNYGMLKHATHAAQDDAIAGSRALLSDVRKLLKLSRIG